VWTRNFELDSLAYFLMYLWNYWTSPGLYRPESLLMEPLVHDAVVTVLKVLEIEQHHEERSPYRYSELPRDGLGPPTKYTGGAHGAWDDHVCRCAGVHDPINPYDRAMHMQDPCKLPFVLPASRRVCTPLLLVMV
jgi:meiotically up-regulated gene 157 (Mug157) protein